MTRIAIAFVTLLLTATVAGCSERLPAGPAEQTGPVEASEPASGYALTEVVGAEAGDITQAEPGPTGPWNVDVRGNASFVARATVQSLPFQCTVHARTVTVAEPWARHDHTLEVYADGEQFGLYDFLVVGGRLFEVTAGPLSSDDLYDSVVGPVVGGIQEGEKTYTLDTTFGLSVAGSGDVEFTFVYTVMGLGLTKLTGETPVELATDCGTGVFAWEAARNFTSWIPGDGGGLVEARDGITGAMVAACPALDVAGAGRLRATAVGGPLVATVQTPEGAQQWVLDGQRDFWRFADGGSGKWSCSASGGSTFLPHLLLLDLFSITSPMELDVHH